MRGQEEAVPKIPVADLSSYQIMYQTHICLYNASFGNMPFKICIENGKIYITKIYKIFIWS